jgi:hypothetical protein
MALHSLCVQALVLLCPGIQTTLHGLCMALQRSFTPADSALVIGDLDEEPARRHAEVLDGSDAAHSGGIEVGSRDVYLGAVCSKRCEIVSMFFPKTVKDETRR